MLPGSVEIRLQKRQLRAAPRLATHPPRASATSAIPAGPRCPTQNPSLLADALAIKNRRVGYPPMRPACGGGVDGQPTQCTATPLRFRPKSSRRVARHHSDQP